MWVRSYPNVRMWVHNGQFGHTGPDHRAKRTKGLNMGALARWDAFCAKLADDAVSAIMDDLTPEGDNVGEPRTDWYGLEQAGETA